MKYLGSLQLCEDQGMRGKLNPIRNVLKENFYQYFPNGSRYCEEIFQVYFYIIQDFACFEIFLSSYVAKATTFNFDLSLNRETKALGFLDFCNIALKFGGRERQMVINQK